MQHYFSLLDFKKAFKHAQAYHQHAIKYGDPQTKSFHMDAHVNAITKGHIPIHNDSPKASKPSKGAS